uniref:Uncharacterized protein TP-0789 domain-containing protein n=1 Tax=Magnetococcus massalia (strain MO-1) TaxID=451514 RepID=A0A1S7LKA5_MAGMO|nr:conserved exported protein of unknown function [Candidatus Magnetococcus massalia]
MKLKSLLLMATLALPALAPLDLRAETAEEKGLALVQEADRRDAGYQDLTADMVMTLTNRHGETSVRNLRIRMKEVEGDGDKSLSIFDQPRDVKGTAMLTHSHPIKPDDQWMYLPALKRVKRISSRNKSGPFMGSEFAFEDLGSQEVEKYSYKYIRDEAVDGRDSYLIERRPAYKYSGYTRQEVWMDKERWQPNRVIYYDRKNALLKTQTFEGYKQYLNKFWRVDAMHMINHQTGKKTTLEWKDYKFQSGLGDRNFHKSGLKRVR